MNPSPYLSIGEVLKGRYEIRREVGRGGYSVVYAALDRSLGTEVAVKLLVPPPTLGNTARERMRREVQAVRGLNHEHIVGIHDFLEEGAWSFIIMDLIPGPDLAVRVQDRGPLPLTDAIQLGRAIADALAFAHRHGVLHRDVKPQNIILAPDGRARLTDFGAARIEGQVTMTQTGGLVGTLAYSAPEVLAGHRADARADVYALGMTLYFALVGRLPDRLSPHLPPPALPDGYHPRDLRPAIPPAIDALVARATAAAPGRRFPTAGGMLEALASDDTSLRLSTADLGADLAECVLCGGPDPLGLVICPSCGGGEPTRGDAMIMLGRPTSQRARDDLHTAVRNVVGPHAPGADLTAVVEGEQPLLRVHSDAVGTVLKHLLARGIPATLLPERHAWRAVPLRYYGALVLMLLMGWSAGEVVPALTPITPLLVALWLLLGIRAVRRPAIAPHRRPRTIPPAVEHRILQTMTRLPSHAARHLLADFVRTGTRLHTQLTRLGASEAQVQLEGLLGTACDSAEDIAELDDHLLSLERHRDRLPATSSDNLRLAEMIATTEKTRDALVHQQLEALATLAKANQRAMTSAGSASVELGILSANFERESEAHAAALRELEVFLAEAPALA